MTSRSRKAPLVSTDPTTPDPTTPDPITVAPITVALPKGRLQGETLDHFAAAGLPVPGDFGRRLVVTSPDGSLRYLLAKPADVPTYVEYGAADLGVCGLDVLRESGREVYEPLLLPYGYCRLALAGHVDRPDYPLRWENQPRVATKYPRLAAAFFRERGVNAEIIELSGSVELGPLVGLAELIVDLVDTGHTLRANGLAELRVIMQSQAVLIANRASFRLRSQQIQAILSRLAAALPLDQPANTQ